MKKFFTFVFVCSLSLIFGGFFAMAETENVGRGEISPELSAEEVVARMGPGWNLGNTFDATARGENFGAGARFDSNIHYIPDIETIWLSGRGNVTSYTLIKKVKAAGFDTLRIPVTWSKVADPSNNWQIRADWLERVQEVVEWALAEDMHVILNMHHEEEHLGMDIENAYESDHPGNVFVTAIWRQVAEYFNSYGDRLLFATLNEPRNKGGEHEWSGGTQTVRDNVNYLNQAALDVIRGTGGNNRYRIVLVPTTAASSHANAMRDFVVPTDPENSVNKLVWAIHTYSPFGWAHDGNGDYQGEHLIRQDLQNVKTNADRLGLPVILSEWGSMLTSRSGSGQSIRNRNRLQHAEDFARIATELGMVTAWWDNNSFTMGADQNFGLIPRALPHDIPNQSQEIINRMMLGYGREEFIVEIEEVEPTPTPTASISVPSPNTTAGRPPSDVEVDPLVQDTENNDTTPEAPEPAERGTVEPWIWGTLFGVGVAVGVAILGIVKAKKRK
ncbi:MAG: glycoside hydrolase family 5 protein [Defluviitaleaceae bacterium]|nr:glycoside hydrolase family 5 protein [Defluviitaleaceae bacterium]